MFFSRISGAGYLSKKFGNWIMGDDDFYDSDDDSDDDTMGDTFRFSMIFKSMEGPLEAAPQLILQLYIITRAGLHWSLGGKIKHF